MCALNTHRSFEKYNAVFQFLVWKNVYLGYDIRGTRKDLVVDFERAFISAAEYQEFVITTDACFFYLCQCHWRKIQALCFTARHKEDAAFALEVKCISALAFIPTEHVLDAFEVMIMIYRMILRSFCRILKILSFSV